MALLTHLPFEAAEALLAEYGLSLCKLEPLHGGTVNSNFQLSARRGLAGEERMFFARIYEQQQWDGASLEPSLVEYLAEQGLPVAQAVRRIDQGYLASFQNKPFALYAHIKGHVLGPGEVTIDIAQQIGVFLGRLHSVPRNSRLTHSERFGLPYLGDQLSLVERSGRADLIEPALRLRQLHQSLQKQWGAGALPLPSGIIHGDVFRDNVLFSGGTIAAVVDFESASSGPYLYDLVVAILAWCFLDDFDTNLAKAMVQGYVSHRPLSAHEREQLYHQALMVCLRFATTRLVDFSLKLPSTQKPRRDYQRFLDRLDAVEAGALHCLAPPNG